VYSDIGLGGLFDSERDTLLLNSPPGWLFDEEDFVGFMNEAFKTWASLTEQFFKNLSFRSTRHIKHVAVLVDMMAAKEPELLGEFMRFVMYDRFSFNEKETCTIIWDGPKGELSAFWRNFQKAWQGRDDDIKEAEEGDESPTPELILLEKSAVAQTI
jgi:hypothetical protein